MLLKKLLQLKVSFLFFSSENTNQVHDIEHRSQTSLPNEMEVLDDYPNSSHTAGKDFSTNLQQITTIEPFSSKSLEKKQQLSKDLHSSHHKNLIYTGMSHTHVTSLLKNFESSLS